MNDIRLEIIVKTEVNLEFKPVSSWLNKHQNNNAKKTPSNSYEPKHITQPYGSPKGITSDMGACTDTRSNKQRKPEEGENVKMSMSAPHPGFLSILTISLVQLSDS